MADFVLLRRVWVPRPRPEVFAFFAAPENLPAVNPPSAALRWLSPPPAALDAGAVLDFSVRALVARVRWRVIVRELDAPYRFVDVQLRGPFRRWEHLHRFVEGPAGADLAADGTLAQGWADAAGPPGTWVIDRVTYGLPLGPLGDLVHRVAVRRQLASLFAYRERRIRELLGG
jgi:ligand-binding SRPBCC domain-containing protein